MTILATAFSLLLGAAAALPAPAPAEVVVSNDNSWEPKGPVDNLLPALHWKTNTSDLNNLSPTSNHDLYYTRSGYSSPVDKHFFANVNANWTRPAVVLEQSKRISSVSCSDGELQVLFADQAAYAHAQHAWPASGDFVVITHTSDCDMNTTVRGQREYLNVTDVDFETGLSALLSVAPVNLTQITDTMKLDWGVWHPTEDAAIASGAPSTIEETSESSCGTPPSATISGFPAAGCNKDFDATIDNAIGYLNFSSSADVTSSLEEFLPGLNDTDNSPSSFDTEGENITDSASSYNYDYYKNKRDLQILQKRWSLWGAVQKCAHAVVHAVTTVAHDVKAVVQTAVTVAKDAVKFVADVVANGFDPSLDTNAQINLAPSQLQDSPWGQQYQIWSKEKTSSSGTASGNFALYCVDCGVHGAAHIAGHLSFSLLHGINAGNLSITGNLGAGLGLGLDAEVTYNSGPLKKNIITAGLPGFSIPKIIVVGPELALDAALEIDVTAQGQVLVGASASLPNFEIYLDIVDGHKSHTSGFTPVVNHTFQAHAAVEANAKFGLPFQLGVGLDILLLKNGKKMASVITEPSIDANLKIDTAADADCQGISYSANLGLDAKFDLFDVKEFDIFKLDSPNLASGCFSIGSGSSSTASATATATATDASSTDSSASATAIDASSTDSSATTTATDASSTDSSATATATDASSTDSTATATGTDAPTNTADPTTTDSGSADSTASLGDNGSSTPTTTDSGASDPTETPAMDATHIKFIATGHYVSENVTSAWSISNITIPKNVTLPSLGGADSAFAKNLTASADSEEVSDLNAPNEDGFTYATILDQTQQYALTSDEDGNLRLDSANATANNETAAAVTWAVYQNIIGADANERVLHYYPDTMAAFGVSRLRIGDAHQLPKTSDMVTFAPLNVDGDATTSGVYVAFDSKGDMFYPVACNFANDRKPAKLFLASNSTTGPATLEANGDLRYIVSGGDVTKCSFIALIASGTAGF